MKRKLPDGEISSARKRPKVDRPPSISELFDFKKSEEEKQGKLTFLERKSRKKLKKLNREKERERRRKEIQMMREQRQKMIEAHKPTASKTMSKEELEDLRGHYMDRKPLNTRKYIASSEKFKINKNFDWDLDDDTSKDVHPHYEKKFETSFFFGRGKRGGGLQSKSSFYDKMVKKKGRAKKKDRFALDVAPSRGNWRNKPLQQMTERDWRFLKDEFEIIAKGKGCPPPIRSWKEGNLPPQLLGNLATLSYDEPTPIQMQCIPIGLARKDMMAVAETGSGKTAAFSIPLIDFVWSQPRMTKLNYMEGPYALVLAPTRELAQQIEAEIKRLVANSTTTGRPNTRPGGLFRMNWGEGRIRVGSLVGGIALVEQQHIFLEGCEILVATPGRLLGCLEERRVVLNQCFFVVLDEADKMVELQFEKELIRILDFMPDEMIEDEVVEEIRGRPVGGKRKKKKGRGTVKEEFKRRTTFMFSATMPVAIRRIALKYLRPNYVSISIGEVGRVVDRIKQEIVYIRPKGKKKKKGKRGEEQQRPQKQRWGQESEEDVEIAFAKRRRILPILEKLCGDGNNQILIFMNEKKNVEGLKRYLSGKSFSVTYYHGGKDQEKRAGALDGFRDGIFQILVCTDLAGRGINVLSITHVINFDMPTKISTYKHRIGRTGRMGRTGESITFISDKDEYMFYDLRKLLVKCNQKIPEELQESEAAKINPELRRRYQELEDEKMKERREIL